MSARSRMLVGFLLANIAIVTVAAIVFLNRPATPPLIQGVLLPQSRALQDFSLLDHNNEIFTNENLKGRWHLVSYGFTTCPDICPTTLSQLSIVATTLEKKNGGDIGYLFYTVDHRRDTVSQMASYVPFFHPEFIGLTHVDNSENPHLAFEKSLGIAAQLIPENEPDSNPDANNYSVNHGVALFLINPAGELQAILKPDTKNPGMHSFDPKIILRDYLAIRDYLG